MAKKSSGVPSVSSSSATPLISAGAIALLIFFLLTSSFVSNFGIKVNVPKAETGAQTEQQFIPVTVTKEGEFYVAGESVVETQLSQAIREEYNRKPNGTLLLRADKEAMVDNAVRVMNIGKALDMRIVMATEQGSP